MNTVSNDFYAAWKAELGKVTTHNLRLLAKCYANAVAECLLDPATAHYADGYVTKCKAIHDILNERGEV